MRALIAEARERVFVEESVNRYVVALLRHTRADARLYLGASPRAGIALLRVAKARALADGRDFVSPDDVKALAEPVLAHRLILAPEARAAGLDAAASSSARRSSTRRFRYDRARPARARARRARPTSPPGRSARSRSTRSRSGCWPPSLARLAVDRARRAGRCELRRTLPAGERFEGDDVEVAARLELERAARARGRSCCASGSASSASARRHSAPAAASPRYVLEALPRGRYEFEAAVAVIEDPFGLERVEQPLEAPGALLVYPRLVELDRLFSEAGTPAHDGRRLLLRRPSGFDLHSVREYEQGESLRKVHWRSTARRGQLMVKELEDAPRDEVAVVLDADPAAVVGESFDVQVRAAGSILLAHARRGRRAVLVVNGAAPEQQRTSLGRRRLAPGARPARRGRAGARAAARRAARRRVERGRARSLELAVVTAVAAARASSSAWSSARSPAGSVSLVFVDPASFAGRAADAPVPELLRLQAAGVRSPWSAQRRRPGRAARRRRVRGGGAWVGHCVVAALGGAAARVELAAARAAARRGSGDARARRWRSPPRSSGRARRTLVGLRASRCSPPARSPSASVTCWARSPGGCSRSSAAASSSSTTSGAVRPARAPARCTGCCCSRCSRSRSPLRWPWPPVARASPAIALVVGVGWPGTLLARPRPAARGGSCSSPCSALPSAPAAGPVAALGAALAAGTLIVVAALAATSSPAFAKHAFLDWQHWDLYTKPAKPVDVSYVWNSSYSGLTFPRQADDGHARQGGPQPHYWRVSVLNTVENGIWFEEVSTRVRRPAGAARPARPRRRRASAQRGLGEAARDDRGARATTTCPAASVPVRFAPGGGVGSVSYDPTGIALAGAAARAGTATTSGATRRARRRAQLAALEAALPGAIARTTSTARSSRASTRSCSAHRAAAARALPDDRLRAGAAAAAVCAGCSALAEQVAGGARSPYARRGRARALVPLRRRLHLRPAPAEAARRACRRSWTSSTRTQERLLPALRRRDGADAALPRDPGARRGRLHERQLTQHGEWVVSDHDAHMWVEVWFRGWGWLPFDPTPSRGGLAGPVLGLLAELRHRRGDGRARGQGRALKSRQARWRTRSASAPSRALRLTCRSSGPRRPAWHDDAASARLGDPAPAAPRDRRRGRAAGAGEDARPWLALPDARPAPRWPAPAARSCATSCSTRASTCRRARPLSELAALVEYEFRVEAEAFGLHATAARFAPPAGAREAGRAMRRELRALRRGIRRSSAARSASAGCSRCARWDC